MKTIRRIISAVLAIVMVICVIPFSTMKIFATDESENVISGMCGKDAFWNFNSSTGLFTVSGTGNMYDYWDGWMIGEDYEQSPWKNIKTAIKSVIIEDGITSIGNGAFSLCNNLKTVSISETVLSLG